MMQKDNLLGQSLFGPWSLEVLDASCMNAEWAPLTPALEANVVG